MSHTHGIVDEENDETGPPPPAKIEHTTTVLHHCIGHRFISKTQIQSGEKWDHWTAILDGPDGPAKPGRTGSRTGLRTGTARTGELFKNEPKYHNSLQNTKT